MKRKTEEFNEVFFYDPHSPCFTDEWKPNPYIQGEWYKLLLINSNGLIECRITKDIIKSDAMDKDYDSNMYTEMGDYIYDHYNMNAVEDFMRGFAR